MLQIRGGDKFLSVVKPLETVCTSGFLSAGRSHECPPLSRFLSCSAYLNLNPVAPLTLPTQTSRETPSRSIDVRWKSDVIFVKA